MGWDLHTKTQDSGPQPRPRLVGAREAISQIATKMPTQMQRQTLASPGKGGFLPTASGKESCKCSASCNQDSMSICSLNDALEYPSLLSSSCTFDYSWSLMNEMDKLREADLINCCSIPDFGDDDASSTKDDVDGDAEMLSSSGCDENEGLQAWEDLLIGQEAINDFKGQNENAFGSMIDFDSDGTADEEEPVIKMEIVEEAPVDTKDVIKSEPIEDIKPVVSDEPVAPLVAPAMAKATGVAAKETSTLTLAAAAAMSAAASLSTGTSRTADKPADAKYRIGAADMDDPALMDLVDSFNTAESSSKGVTDDGGNTSSSSTSASTINGEKPKSKPKRKRKPCMFPNCNKRSRSQGLCIAHGGGKRCEVDGCNKSSQRGNLCIRHGGGKRCRFPGCDKAAQSNSLCKAHGGGPRCQYKSCNKSSQGGGFCRSHGGGRRCRYEGCLKGTQRGNFCALHGGSRLCEVEGCVRNDRGGGLCAYHGGGKRCTVDNCSRPCRRNGMCSTHLRLWNKNELENATVNSFLRVDATSSSSSSSESTCSSTCSTPMTSGSNSDSVSSSAESSTDKAESDN